MRLSEKQLDVLRAVLRAERHRGPALDGALEALDLARWDDLPEAQLPWLEVVSEARRQGVSEADVIWDRAGQLDDPPPMIGQPHADWDEDFDEYAAPDEHADAA